MSVFVFLEAQFGIYTKHTAMNLEDIVYNNHRAFLSDTFHVSNEQWIFNFSNNDNKPIRKQLSMLRKYQQTLSR